MLCWLPSVRSVLKPWQWNNWIFLLHICATAAIARFSEAPPALTAPAAGPAAVGDVDAAADAADVDVDVVSFSKCFKYV